MGFITSFAIGLFNYHDYGLGEDEEPFRNEKIIALKAEIRELSQNLPPMTPPTNRIQQEIIKREEIIHQIRIERDKTGVFYKYAHLIIFIFIGILIGTIRYIKFE